MHLRISILAAAALTLVLFYWGAALGELWGTICGGHYSLSHPNPDCRWPVWIAIGFYLALGVTLFLVFLAFRRRNRSQS
jgi:hypothetical protein